MTQDSQYCFIINYHYIYNIKRDEFRGFNGLSEKTLRYQIQELKKNFEIVSLRDYFAENNKKDRICILTFDDGFINCYHSVFSILKKEKIKANFFISSKPYIQKEVLNVQKIHMLIGKLGTEKFRSIFYDRAGDVSQNREKDLVVDLKDVYRYDNEIEKNFKLDLNYRINYTFLDCILNDIFNQEFGEQYNIVKKLYMNIEQIREMEKDGNVFGIHTHSHRILSRLGNKEKEIEIKKCSDFLESIINYRPDIISYPFGHRGTISINTYNILRRNKIKYRLTMYRIINRGLENPYLLHRFDVNDAFSGTEIKSEFAFN